MLIKAKAKKISNIFTGVFTVLRKLTDARHESHPVCKHLYEYLCLKGAVA